MAGSKRDDSHPDKTAQGPAAALRALARLLQPGILPHPPSPTQVKREQNRTSATMKSKNDDFLTVKEVAALLGVSERHVRRLISRAQPPGERLPSYRLGRLVRVRRSDLEEFLIRRVS